jgi:hypothetical protein
MYGVSADTIKHCEPVYGGSYRYGMNAQERADEISGKKGGGYTAEFWEYNPLLGRRWNIDPLFKNFPWQSPYAAFDNNPIVNNDPKGAAAENQTGGPDERRKKLVDKRSHESDIHGETKKWERLGERIKKLNYKIMGGDTGVGIPKKANYTDNYSQKDGLGGGVGKDSPPVPERMLTEPLPVSYGEAGEIIDDKLYGKTPLIKKEMKYYSRYLKQNPDKNIYIYGGTNDDPEISRTNAEHIKKKLEEAGISEKKIFIIPNAARGSAPPQANPEECPFFWTDD